MGLPYNVTTENFINYKKLFKLVPIAQYKQ